MTTPLRTAEFIGTLGVNTHLDFAAYGYQNIATVESAVRYLGLNNLRDSAETASDATLWQQIAQATGAKFDDYIAETSPAGMATDLGFAPALASQGILAYLEGGNEEDDAYPASLGNTLAVTAAFQHQVFAIGQTLGLPVINMSFGAGWTSANAWQGNYDKVGDLSAVSNFANAHTYPNPGQLPGDTIGRLNGLANLAAASRPVITTEIGWDENLGFSQADVARYTLETALDGIKYGDVKTYFYALFDDGSGKFGLMNADGTAKPAGQALHNLTTLLQDSGAGAASFAPRSLSYTLSTADNTVLMQKSDGSHWLSVWNETVGAHAVTLTLGSAASQIKVFDPLTGTTAVQTASNTGSVTFTVPDHPVILEIVDGMAATTPTTVPAGTPSVTPAVPPSAPKPVISTPGPRSVAAGASVAIGKVSIADPWAAAAPGSLTLNVTASVGTIAMKDAAGKLLVGSGTSAIHGGGTLAQINAELATLAYTAAAGTATASLSVDVWDQAGVEATGLIGVTVTAPAPVTAPTGTTNGTTTGTITGAGGTTPTPIMVPATAANVVELISVAHIVATSGNHMMFIGGTGDVVSATGGTEIIQAYQGGNSITTGAGNDTIRFAGTGNVIDAGGGNNLLMDSGGGNTIVLPTASKGFDDVFGYVMPNNDRLDLRPMLAGTNWTGDIATIGNFVKLATSGANAVINVDPTGVAGGATYRVATLEGSGPVSLGTLLAHAITS